jgi:citrate synthase
MSTEEAPHTIEASGLEDVVAATTRLSDVDGENGRLTLAGQSVEALAGSVTFEDAVFLLFRGNLPAASDRERVSERLAAGRATAFAGLGRLGDALAAPDAMDALRAGFAHLANRPGEDPLDETLRLTGSLATLAAAWIRPEAPVPPDPALGHAADYLRTVTGQVPSAAQVAALDAYLVTVIDHGMNASTFAARVVASTASDTVSAIGAAIGALKGRLHGGAPGPVLDMLDAIGEPGRARAWLAQHLARGERIMGMGHRIYRVRDPRAAVLERALTRLEAAGAPRPGVGLRLELARAIEREAEALLAERYPRRPLKANVEFFTAVLLEAIGLPRALFTPTFAASRVAGWCAHADEQRRHGRLIRPRSRYVAVTDTA